MARYRKIDIRMWGDREVLRLSRPQPNGQSLWVYLLSGPATGIIPGAYRAREGGLADELGWSLEAFRDAFAEVNGDAFQHGLGHGAAKPLAKADWNAGMVWVPKGIKHNPPNAINVITSWREAWDELPECDLKLEAYQGLRAFVDGMSKGFLKAFDEAIPRPSWMPSRKASPIQDQDQEQDQEGLPRAHAIRGAGAREHCGNGAPNGTTTPAPNGSSRVSGKDAAAVWQRVLAMPGGRPTAAHAYSHHAEHFDLIAAACNAVVLENPANKPANALQAVIEWFWFGPDGPVQSGRIARGTPKLLAKGITEDLDQASAWWLARKQQQSQHPQPEPHEAAQ